MLNFFIRMVCILSWSTIFFMPKKSVKRYLPVTIFSGLLTVTTVLIGVHYHFWEEKGISRKRMWNHLALVLGPFSVANMWIFHKTYGKIGLYFFTNLINNFIYGFGVMPLMKKLNFVNYVKFTRKHHIIVAMIESFILYGYQSLIEKTFFRLSHRKGLKS